MRSALVVLCVVLFWFFALFSVHAQTPVQQQVKAALESGGADFPFSAQENSHMRDVFGVLTGARLVAAVAFVLVLWLLPSLRAADLRAAGGVLVLLPALLSTVPFSRLFAAFHAVFFPQGNWRFPPDSSLLAVYPQEFFVWYSAALAGFLVVSGALLFASSWRWQRFRTSPA